MNRKAWRRLAGGGLAAGLALGLGACTGGDAGDDASTPAESTRVTSTPLPEVPDLGPEPQGIVADVQITECPTEAGDQTAHGTATNSAGEPRDLSIIVIWLKNDSGDPLGSGIALLEDVPPGETVEWSVDANVVEQADRCVLNAQAGQMGGAAAEPEATQAPADQDAEAEPTGDAETPEG